MKAILVPALGLSLLVVIVAFIGVGFGVGALSITPTSPTTNTCSGPTGLAFCSNFSAAPALAGSFVANWQNGISTPITLSMSVNPSTTSTSTCASDLPGWIGGTGGQASYLVIQVIDSLSGKPVSFSAQSTIQVSTGGTAATVSQFATGWVISYNASNAQRAWCFNGYTSGAVQPWSPVTFTLTGQFDDYSKVQVTWITSGYYCDMTVFGIVVPACSTYPNGGTTAYPTPWTVAAVGQAVLRNGGGYFSWNGQTLYNGQSFTVPVTTYYDAGQGFTIQFLYPSVRGSTVISSVNVPDEKTAYGVTFTVPSNAAQNSTTPSYNQFQLTLYSPVAQYTYEDIPIDVSPQYAPPAPVATFQDLSGNSPPLVGDQVSVSLFGQGIPAQGVKVTSFILWLWYLMPTTSVGSLPPTGSAAWITPGGQQGDTLSAAVSTYGNGTASFPFTIGQPFSIALQVESVTNTAQTSVAQTTLTIYVEPAGCQGPSCHPGTSLTTWEIVGPILFSLIFALAAAFLAVVVPMPVTYRWAVVVVVVVALVVLAAFGTLQSFFAAGAILNPNGK